jgi:pseudouridine-5'-phosphate glycosidase/pseudouridine kinase
MANLSLRFPGIGGLYTKTKLFRRRFPIFHQLRVYNGLSIRASTNNSHPSPTTFLQPNPIFNISKSVKSALALGKPVVALESTIYTHGFPYPDNVALANDLEAIVYKNGGVPATIGILNGVARVGLDTSELSALASSAGKPETMKVSRRDLPYILGMVSFF